MEEFQTSLEDMVIQLNEKNSQGHPYKRWVLHGVGYIVTLIFIYFLLREIKVADLIETLAVVSPASLVLSVVVLSCGYFIRAARWWVMLRVFNDRLRLISCVGPFVMSMAANNIFPLRAGDVIRMFTFRELHGLAPVQVLGTLMLERLLDLMVLLGLFFITLRWVTIDIIPQSFINLLRIMVISSAMLLFCILALSGYAGRLLNRLGETDFSRKHVWCGKLLSQFNRFFDTIQLASSLSRLMLLISLSVLCWLLEGGVYLITASALNYHGSFMGPYFASSTGALSTLLPSSPGYIGTFDYFVMLGLRAFGADPKMATAFAILVHLILWLSVTLAGFIYFLGARSKGISWVKPDAETRPPLL